MKVLIVANNKPGQFSPFVIEQVSALEKLGVEFDFFGIDRKGVSGYLSKLIPLKKKIHDFQPDLIHAHYGLSGFLANLQRSIPVVTTFHGSDIHSRGINIKISKTAAHFSAHNIFVSKWLQNLSGFKGGEYSVIPCGVDTDTFHPMNRDEAREQLGWRIEHKYVLFASTFDNEVKNSPLAKAAVSLLPQVELIELRGYKRDQVNMVMNAANCLLMTSHREGSPVVVKEAMSCGIPIVSVNVGDVAGVMAETKGCYITTYDANDIAEKLQQAISFIGRTNGPQRIVDLGLSNKIIAHRILEIYKKVIELSK